MNSSPDAAHPIFFSEEAYAELNKHLQNFNPSRQFVLVDSNTHTYCLPAFLSKLENTDNLEIIEMDAGEKFKDLDTCSGVWKAMSELGGDRKSLLINLGGGVVTDLGGFVASTFKRGIPFINVPTSLLAMVDASVGGKTGIDLGNLKNQIGVINQPQLVLIDSNFLDTLPKEHMRSGLAEILKHGLIADESYWDKVSSLKTLNKNDLNEIIKESIAIKSTVVSKDPFEHNLRKILNYGHTLGHAIESYFLTHPKKKTLLHGEAVAAGLILESYISSELLNFPKKKLNEITLVILDIFGKIAFEPEDLSKIFELMKFDKKNEHGTINFVLLKDIGKAQIDCTVPTQILEKSFKYYANH